MGYINNSRKWDKCAVLLNTAHPRKNNTPLCANALTSSDFFAGVSCCHVVSSDALRSSVLTDIRRKGACIQRGKAQNFYYGGVTRRHSFGECVPKKKDSRMSPFLPLCVQHSKGFPPGIVQARLESGKSAGSLRY